MQRHLGIDHLLLGCNHFWLFKLVVTAFMSVLSNRSHQQKGVTSISSKILSHMCRFTSFLHGAFKFEMFKDFQECQYLASDRNEADNVVI